MSWFKKLLGIGPRKVDEKQVDEIKRRLRVNMSISEINEILGPPTASMGKYTQWDRPEGTYRLIIEAGRLSRIYDAPKGIYPSTEEISSPNEEFFYQRIINFIDENELSIGTLEEFRKGQKDFSKWGDGVIVGTKEWIVKRLSSTLIDIGSKEINTIHRSKNYGWQSSNLEDFTIRIEVSIPSGMLAGYYIGRIDDIKYGLFGYGIGYDESQSST